MWSRIWLSLKSNFPLIVLLVVLGVITWINYPWLSSLLGWDSVQPELDFGINLRRAMTSVWVGNQGVGHIGGHGYATILIQGVIEWVISLVVGVAQTRGVFIFSMLWLGPIGVYFLWKKWFKNTGKFVSWGAMLSGLFYLLNLGTVQVFFAPLEAFTIFYGFLPWAILSIVNYLSEPSRKNLIWLLVTQIIFSLIGFIPPQFIAYGMVVLALLAGYVLERRRDVVGAFKKVLTVGTILIAANLYWLAPVSYYSVHGASSYAKAKNNQVSTPDFQYMSEARGKWSDVALMRGFFIDSSDSVIKGEGKFFEIFEPWNNYLQYNVERVGYGLFIVSMLGLLALIAKKGKRSLGLSMLLVLGIGWVAIAQAEEPFTTVANLMHNIPVVGQAFRAAFTKFVGLLIFVYAIGFGYGVFAIYNVLREKLVVGVILVSIGVGGLIFYTWPMFEGNLIYERMKITMPSEYGQVMKFFNNQDKSSRIAYLPSAWMWGWQVHEWGYSGSGFLWYGIEQPILDRAFDVWSLYNEGFYNQIATALYGCESGQSQITNSPILKLGCEEQVARVLQKYDVRYVLLDESVIAPGQDAGILRVEEMKAIAKQLGWEKVFSEGFLTLWRIPECTPSLNKQMCTNGEQDDKFVSAPESYTWVEGDTSKVRQDVIYADVGTYVSVQHTANRVQQNMITYPFVGLMRENLNSEYRIGDSEDGVTVSTDYSPNRAQGTDLLISGFKQGKKVEMGYKLMLENSKLIINWEAIYLVNGQEGPRLENSEYRIKNGVNNVWVQIGGNRARYIKDGEVGKGTAELIVGEPIDIRIYNGQGKEEVVGLSEEQKCGEYRCWATPLEKATGDSLLQTITHYRSEKGIQPEVCLDLEGEPYECVNEVKRGINPLVITQLVNKGERYWLDIVVRGSGVEIGEPGIVWYKRIMEESLAPEIWSEFTVVKKFGLNEKQVKIEVKSEPKIYDFAKLGKSGATTCDVLKRGSATKSQITNSPMTNLAQVTQYTADERGAACDFVEMNELTTKLPYLMRIRGENREGRSVKLFLFNTGSERNDLEYLLNTGSFDQTFAVLPWEFPGSYSLNIETRSFGQRAENVIYPVEVRYFPLDQIAGAKLINNQTPNTNNQTIIPEINNKLKIINVRKIGTWLYRVRVQQMADGMQRTANSEQQSQGLVKLSQGYDEGWIGLEIRNQKSEIRKLDHVKVDGWANGWIVDECTPSSNAKCAQSERPQLVMIFYWPQMLEYLGFGMMGVVGWQLGKRRKK